MSQSMNFEFSFIFFLLLQQLWNKLILNDFGDVFRRYKTAFREEKMTIVMFYNDIKLILRRENDFGDILTKTRNDLKPPETTWNHLKPAKKNYKTTWNHPKPARTYKGH